MVNIIKASGEVVPYDSNKIRRSLRRAGADERLIDQIVDEVSKLLKENMTTHEIYRIAFRRLRKKSETLAAKYHLKRAIMQLGQSGYPFEKYVAELLRHQGYTTRNNQIIEGFCVSHEVDVVAEKKEELIFVECKYHNRQGIRCDVKVSLYFKARFLDIVQGCKEKVREKKLNGCLVTNTRFTDDASQYGKCAGLQLVSWDYPKRGSLKEQIELSGLYPITCITRFTKAELAELMANDIVLCKSITTNPSLLKRLRIPKTRLESIIKQCNELYSKFDG